jgi:hypothetical protein
MLARSLCPGLRIGFAPHVAPGTLPAAQAGQRRPGRPSTRGPRACHRSGTGGRAGPRRARRRHPAAMSCPAPAQQPNAGRFTVPIAAPPATAFRGTPPGSRKQERISGRAWLRRNPPRGAPTGKAGALALAADDVAAADSATGGRGSRAVRRGGRGQVPGPDAHLAQPILGRCASGPITCGHPDRDVHQMRNRARRRSSRRRLGTARARGCSRSWNRAARIPRRGTPAPPNPTESRPAGSQEPARIPQPLDKPAHAVTREPPIRR